MIASVSRPTILAALLIALASLALAACSTEDHDQVAQTLERAAKATKGLGMVVTTTGTVSVEGISQPLRSRATIAPDGRHARMTTQAGALSMEQYLDGRFMLMSVDAFPGAGAGGLMPPGTRYLKFDIDKVNQSMGINSTLSEMQSLDPRRAAQMLSDIAEVKSAGTATIGGVKVTRYSADVDLEELVKAMSKGGDTSRLKKMLGDGKMQVQVALDGNDRIRGFGMKGDFLSGMKIDFNAVVSSYSRNLKVEIPSRGVHDVTSAIVGAMGAFKQP